MSLSPPRVRDIDINNGSTTYQLYWCYQCNRTVRITSTTNPSEIVCPRCFGQFLSEFDRSIRPRDLLDYTDFDPSPEARLLEVLSLMFDPPVGAFNHGLDDPEADARERPGFWQRQLGHEGRGMGTYSLNMNKFNGDHTPAIKKKCVPQNKLRIVSWVRFKMFVSIVNYLILNRSWNSRVEDK